MNQCNPCPQLCDKILYNNINDIRFVNNSFITMYILTLNIARFFQSSLLSCDMSQLLPWMQIWM